MTSQNRIEFSYGKCIFKDCLEGLKSLPTNSFDLCFTDPPHNINLEHNINCGKEYKDIQKSAKIYYQDEREDYPKWCLEWFNELERVCDRILIYCGGKNLEMWYNMTSPLEQIVYFKPFITVITATSWTGRWKPLLVYQTKENMFLGRNGTYKLDSNVIIQTKKEDKTKWIHPCPMDKELAFKVMRQLQPESVIDPFLGSGTTAEVCETLGIEWLGFELKKDYKKDITKRLKNIKKLPKQMGIHKYLNT